MYRGKLRLPRTMRDDLASVAHRSGTNRSALLRNVLEEYVAEPGADEATEIVPCIVLTSDVATWERAEAKARAQGLTLSAALRPRLDAITHQRTDA